MKKIPFPLKKGDMGFSVVNLQDVLIAMLDRKAITPANNRLLDMWKMGLVSERSDQNYGPITCDIVKKFQMDHDFTPDGVVDRQTAAGMNELLIDWGAR